MHRASCSAQKQRYFFHAMPNIRYRNAVLLKPPRCISILYRLPERRYDEELLQCIGNSRRRLPDFSDIAAQAKKYRKAIIAASRHT